MLQIFHKYHILKKLNLFVLLSHSNYIRAEIEVLNGCGEAGIANLFTKFLRSKGYDVIEIKNILDARDRKLCGPLAPAEGLYFLKVLY